MPAAHVAVPKAKGGLRPIVGELLRRLTGKCLLEAVREAARDFFWPAQVGVAVPAGAEKAVHATRVLVKLDFANAFNCIDRGAVLQRARDHFPSLARWATWCYGQPSRLQFGDHGLSSTCGVQQGDPLGPSRNWGGRSPRLTSTPKPTRPSAPTSAAGSRCPSSPPATLT